MLAFALKHAVERQLRRVVIVLPYLSIIEQTSAIYRGVFESHFGQNYVLEHHSLAGSGVEKTESDSESKPGEQETAERQRRLLAENWDAPLIITTSVQMLESLFSNRPSACRKLHRLAQSVIFLMKCKPCLQVLQCQPLGRYPILPMAMVRKRSVLYGYSTGFRAFA